MEGARIINLKEFLGNLKEKERSLNLLSGNAKEEEYLNETSSFVSFVVLVTHVTLTTSYLFGILVKNKLKTTNSKLFALLVTVRSLHLREFRQKESKNLRMSNGSIWWKEALDFSSCRRCC
jgi:hypothetical protein